MGWKVRSDKLKLVNARVREIGGRAQIRWNVAQYKIAKALNACGQNFEDGLDITDFQYLTENGLHTPNTDAPMIDVMPELNTRRVCLEEIRNHFIANYKYNIKDFLDWDLKIKDNSSPTWDRFFRGGIYIEDDVFQVVCTILNFDCEEIGTQEREMPVWKKLETLLWQLNHQNQVAKFQDLAQQSHNLVCLKFVQVPGRQIPLFWLLKTLVQPVDNGIQKAGIDFNSLIFSDTSDRLDSIIAQLGLPNRLRNRRNPNAIAREIHKKIVKENQTIVLFFFTHDRQQITQLDELVSFLYQPLLQEFSQRQPQKKLLMVWIDSQTSSQEESEDLDEDGDNYPEYSNIFVSSIFNQKDIISWTNLREVNLLFDRTRNEPSNCPAIENNLADLIWEESQEGQPEFLLRSVYNLCNLNWETYQNSWEKI